MNFKECPCCSNPSTLRLTKTGVDYFQCVSCKTLFSNPLDNSNMVGGGNEVERNTVQNPERIERLDFLFRKRDIDVLDFGCGHGYLVNDLNAAGFRAVGYDAYNEKFSSLPEKNKFDCVTCIEVIEHTSSPFYEIDVMHRSLKEGGVLMIETSFTTIAEMRGIDLNEFFYVSPEVGHSTIFSHHGLDVLMCLKGFKPFHHFNENVRIYIKK